MSKLCRKLLVFFVAFLFSGILAVSLASCGGGGDDIVYKVNFYLDADTNYAYVDVSGEGNISLPTNPSKDGYIFTGWYTDSAATAAFDASATISKNLNLYAGWRALPAAPNGLKWNAKTETLTWNSVSAAEGYSYELSLNNTVIAVATNSHSVEEVGEYEAKVRTVYTTASYTDRSSWSTGVSFEIEAPTYTVNFMDGTTLYESVEVANNVVVLPTEPSKADAHFLGWYKDSNFVNEFDALQAMSLFDLSERGDQSVNVYAKWELKPAAPTAVARAAYENAKAGQEQRIYWSASASENVAGYEISITTISGTSVASQTVTGTEYVLNTASFTQGTTYFYDIVTVSSLTWDNAALKSTAYSGSFVYSIVAEDTFTVTYKLDANTKYTSEYVTDGETASLPPVEPTKTGYIFLKWVYGTNEEDFDNTVVITGDLTVMAKWAAKPVAPSAAEYDDETCTLSWTEVSGAVSYQYRIDGGNWIVTTTNSARVLGLTKGNHTIDFKVTAPVAGVSGNVESETSSTSFEVETLYVVLSVNGSETDLVAVDNGGHITVSDPVLAGYKFIKWTSDGNAASQKINLASATFESTTTIYAIFAELPAQVTEATWDEGTDSISWEAVEGATAYIVRYGSYTNGVTVTTPKIEDVGVSHNGTYELYITTVRADSVYGTVCSEESHITVNIEFSKQLIYSDDGTQIKYRIGDTEYIYVFFAGQSYSSSSKAFGASEYYSGSGNYVVMTTDSTKINIQFTYQFGEDTRTGIVVPQVLNLSYADGYARYNQQINGSTFINTENLYSVGTGMNEDVGSVNFYLPIEFTFGNGALFEDADVNLDLTFYKLVNDEWVEITDNSFGFVASNGGYLLSTALNSGTIKVEVLPTFLNKAQFLNQDAYVRTYVFALNDGVNVYGHEELKTAYASSEIHQINIHSGVVVASLTSEQITASGYAVNRPQSNSQPNNLYADVYRRVATSNELLTINGNYALIDAHTVPKVYWTEAEQAGMHNPHGVLGYTIQNVAVAIFDYRGPSTPTYHYNNRVIFNDLEIYGNTEIKGSSVAEVAIYSGGHNALKVDEGSLSTNNVYIHNSLIANYITSKHNYDNYSYINETICDQNWANAIDSSFTTMVVVTKSRFLASSGAAIHIEDRDDSENASPLYLSSVNAGTSDSEVRHDPGLAIDSETVLDNWMTGAEAWFIAWGFGGTMGSMIKASGGVQGNVLNNFGKSVLKETSSGYTVFNFAMLFKPENDFAQMEVYLIDEDYGYVLGSEQTPSSPLIAADPSKTMAWTSDVRLQGGQLLMQVGQVSNPITAATIAQQVQTYAQAVVEAEVAHAAYSQDYVSPATATYTALTAELLATVEAGVIQAVDASYTGGESAISAAVTPIVTQVIMGATMNGMFGYEPASLNGKNFYSVSVNGSMSGIGHSGTAVTAWIEFGPASGSDWYNQSVDPS